VLEDPQAAALGVFSQMNLAGEQPFLLPRLPIGLSLTPPTFQGPPPSAGQHGRSILHEAGYSDAEVDELIRLGACAVKGDNA
jgi:crotonobetainyl-CoA:carnitine CoA-transferase CaiB-like acyl-CoA transferase